MNEETKQHIRAAIALGASIDTTARLCEVSPSEIADERQRDAHWDRSLAQAEAGLEIRYLHHIHAACKRDKTAKLSVWWLERRWPERYARRAGTITKQQLQEFIERLAAIVATELDDPAALERVADSLANVPLPETKV
jgi:hypothetical protein